MVEQKYKTKLFLITKKIITPKAKIIDSKIKETRVTM
jgi:hypothetical protein